MRTWLRQSWCALRHGHDRVLAFEQKRIFLRCASCQHETPGVVPEPRAPRQRFEGDAQRHVLVALRIVRRRA